MEDFDFSRSRDKFNTIRINHEKEWLKNPVNDNALSDPDYARSNPENVMKRIEFTTRFPGIRVYSSGGSIPYQMSGLIHGYPFYFRSRGGVTRIKISDPHLVQHPDQITPENNPVLLFLAGDTWWSAETESEINTYSPEFGDVFENLISDLSVHPFLYQFSTVETDWETALLHRDEVDPTSDLAPYMTPRQPLVPDIRKSWGHDPESAYHRLISDTAVYHLVDRDHASPIPLNTDDRDIPDMPDFVHLIRTRWKNQV